MDAQNTAERAGELFRQGFNCAESVLLAVAEHFEIESDMFPRVATAFGGGIAGTQGTCGALVGGVMAIGALLGRDDPTGDRARPDATARAFVQWFHEHVHSVLCGDIAGVDFQDPAQKAAFRAPGGAHHTVCVPLVMDATKRLCEILNRL